MTSTKGLTPWTHAASCFAALSLWLAAPSADSFAQPPVWGQLPASRSAGQAPYCQDGTCPPQQQRGASLDSQAFFDSIGGRELAKSIVRVGVGESNGRTNSLGSGTVVESYDDGSGLVVTNHHVVADAASATAGSITYRDGRTSRLAIMAADPVWDLAVLLVDVPADVPAVDVAAAAPAQGEPLMIAGYGAPGAGLQFQLGRFVQRVAPRMGYPFEQLSIEPCQARQGDSGGPVFNSRGSLVACLWGADYRKTVASPCARIRDLLQRVRQRLGRRLRGDAGGQVVQGQNQNPPSLPGPAPLSPVVPPTQPYSPPAESTPPQNPHRSGQPAGGELAAALEKIKTLEEWKIKHSGAPPLPIVEDGKAIAEKIAGDVAGEGRPIGAPLADAAKPIIDAAAPGLISRAVSFVAPYALTALGGLTGFGLPIGGVVAGGWLTAKLAKGIGGMVRNRIAAKRAAAAKQGSAAGTTPPGGKEAPSFDPQSIVKSEVARLAAALKSDLQTTIDAKLSVIGQQASAAAEIVAAKPDPAPTFVPTQVDNPSLIALEKALETFGGQTPANAKWVNLIYSFRDQLLNRAKAA